MADIFDRFDGRDSEKGDIFDKFQPEQESFGKNALRTALQVPQGVAEATTPGILGGLWNLFAHGESELDPYEEANLYLASKAAGKEFSKEEYERNRQEALNILPTVSNIARGIEESTGIPLEPKTRFQKFTRFASLASKGIPGPSEAAPKGYAFRGTNIGLPRPVLGTGVATGSQLLQELGLPEPAADLLSFGLIKPTTESSARISIEPKKKPSGLTERQFEKLENPREVSQSSINKITQKTEKEFRDLASKIIEESPIAETHKGLANDAMFKKNVTEGFGKVEKIAETLPQKFSTQRVKTDLDALIKSKKSHSLTPSEFDKEHNKFLKQFIKETPDKDFTSKELVSQYRKNNKQLSEAYEPGQSFAYNRAKREALLDYNRTIADIIEKEYPNSEFSNLFKETNKRWADISNSESITKFLDDIFNEKIDFKKARQFFDKEGMTVPFKRALGEQGFSKFETLLNDLVSTEKGMKLLKAAEQKGFTDLAKSASAYILHPSAAKAKLGYDALKGGYNTIFEMVLDKPQIAVTWDRGINAMKAGNFKVAEKEFAKVAEAQNALQANKLTKEEAFKKFNERLSKKREVENISKSSEATKTDLKESLKNLKEQRDAIKGNSQESIKKRAPLNKKINEIELEPHNQKNKKLTKEEENHLFGSKKPEKKSKASKNKQNSTKSINEINEHDRLENYKKMSVEDKKERWIYSNEDFPTIKEAEEYLARLKFQQKNPKNNTVSTQADIDNLQNIISEYKSKNNFSHRDIMKEIIDLRKQKSKIKERTSESNKKRRLIDDAIKEKEKEFYSVKRKSEPDLRKYEKPDISHKSLKKQRDYIIDSIDSALKSPPNTEMIHIEVPGDGTFKIWNIEDVLIDFKNKVKKKWPVKQVSKSNQADIDNLENIISEYKSKNNHPKKQETNPYIEKRKKEILKKRKETEESIKSIENKIEKYREQRKAIEDDYTKNRRHYNGTKIKRIQEDLSMLDEEIIIIERSLESKNKKLRELNSVF